MAPSRSTGASRTRAARIANPSGPSTRARRPSSWYRAVSATRPPPLASTAAGERHNIASASIPVACAKLASRNAPRSKSARWRRPSAPRARWCGCSRPTSGTFDPKADAAMPTQPTSSATMWPGPGRRLPRSRPTKSRPTTSSTSFAAWSNAATAARRTSCAPTCARPINARSTCGPWRRFLLRSAPFRSSPTRSPLRNATRRSTRPTSGRCRRRNFAPIGPSSSASTARAARSFAFTFRRAGSACSS